ncbi:MAG TPA: type II toxin-antitoxin system HicA family toxin [candidate division Zixibacteria bacterium]|nr:type II toxin-antitoxin system HicA family toxin [candidate division Zixibacteria bacterium]
MSIKPLPARKIIKVLSILGFRIARKHGSHVVMKHSDGRITVIPVHAGEEIGIGLLLKIIKDARISREQFLELLEKG